VKRVRSYREGGRGKQLRRPKKETSARRGRIRIDTKIGRGRTIGMGEEGKKK